MQLQIRDTTILLPEAVAVLPEDTLDEHNNVHRVAISALWYQDERDKKNIEILEGIIRASVKANWVWSLTFTLDRDDKKVTYTSVIITITEKYGYTFIEFESALSSVKVEVL
jgi:hypothetical protein